MRCSTPIDRFAALGLDGVEAFYPTHDAEQPRSSPPAAPSATC